MQTTIQPLQTATWKQVTTGATEALLPWERWDTPGTIVEGAYQGIAKNRSGYDYLKVLTVLGRQCCNIPTMLRALLAEIDEGTVIQITYQGDKASQGGRAYKVFQVLEALIPEETT